uniref:Rho guanine nucleotide exchange factor (GEF) 19 n=1 Tax=Oncorhynchus mykiss TaxID=8022 RepID=A0A8C7U8W4_ONCMY
MARGYYVSILKFIAKTCFSFLLHFPCVLSVMLPGYGFSPLPDFQPHLHVFRCRGECPSMWFPVSGESQALSEARDDRPLLRQCQHNHIAVCQQERQPPVTPSDNGHGSPTADAQHSTPLPLNHRKHTRTEEDIGGDPVDATSPSSTGGTPNPRKTPPFSAEPLQLSEHSSVLNCGAVENSSATGGSSLARSSMAEHERRRFSASELISRLQLSQRKNSFTLKLGKSLSARVASRDRQNPSNFSPDCECPASGLSTTAVGCVRHYVFDSKYKSTSRHRCSGGASDSAPHSPVGPTPQLIFFKTFCNIDFNSQSPLCTLLTQIRIALSLSLSSAILYQEYSDVAINREILRQQGEEPGAEEEGSFCSSRGSAFSLWQDIPDVRTSGQLDNFSNVERKLQEAKFELVTSEASYIRSLTIAVDHFMLSQELGECLGAQDRQWLFSKLPEVKDVSERFLQDLEHRLEEDILRFDVSDIVLAHCPALRRVYLPYVTNQAYQEQTYQRMLQENARFPGILARLEEDPICQRLPLASFLILPFQRITRLKMLVENILKRTTPGSRDEDTATKAFNELKKIIKECNSSVQSMKRMEELIHLNKKIHFEGKIFPLISQSRWLVKHGELLEVDTQTMSISGSKFKLPTRPVYLHLFNDCLLLSKKKDTWKFMVFVHAKIGQLKVKDLSQKLQGISGFIFHLQLCEGRQLKHQILLKAHTESGKQRWITAMFPSDPLEDIEQATENDDLSQVQCIKSYQAQEHDELTLEKADILQAKTITSDGWVEGIRLSDGERGWFPKTNVEEITSRSARLRNLRENIRVKCVTQKLEEELF